MAKKQAKKAKAMAKASKKIPPNPVNMGENFAQNIAKKFGWDF